MSSAMAREIEVVYKVRFMGSRRCDGVVRRVYWRLSCLLRHF